MSNSQEPDLSRYDVETGADRGAKMELVDKTGKKTGEWINLLGSDSKDYQSKKLEQDQKRLTRIAQTGKARLSASEILDELIERLVVCTKSWSFRVGDNQEFPCSAENIERIYRKSGLIREQAANFVDERENFSRA